MRTILTSLVLALMLASGVQAKPKKIGPISAICVDMKRPPHICVCASEKLVADAPPEAYQLYDKVAKAYRKQRNKGVRLRPAWRMAQASVAKSDQLTPTSLAGQIDPMSDRHLQAILACSRQK